MLLPLPLRPASALTENTLNNLAMHVCQAELAPLEPVRQPLMVDAKQVKYGRLQIMDMHSVFGDVDSQFVGRAKRHA